MFIGSCFHLESNTLKKLEETEYRVWTLFLEKFIGSCFHLESNTLKKLEETEYRVWTLFLEKFIGSWWSYV